MLIPNAIEKQAQELEARAEALRAHRMFDDAARLQAIATDFRHAARRDAEELLNLEQAAIFSRGYSAAYLRRTLKNWGTKRNPLFRKGDIPRHPI